jgi:4-amino-4-deoxy-L-arabinose transferase-like glycosyltransferase
VPNRWFVGIVAILALFLLLSVGYHIDVPLGEGPDEPGHMAYVLFLHREGRLPVQHSGAGGDVPGEGHQPPLAYWLALPAVAWLPPDAPPLDQTANPDFLWNDGTEAAAFNRASREHFPWRGVALAWHLARGVSMLLGAAAVYATWQAARVLLVARFASTPLAEGTALLAAALVAFNPQFLFTSALVTNDMLLAALSAALFWLSIHAATNSQEGPGGVRLALAAGVLFGLALLTKQSALLLVTLLLWTLWHASGQDGRRWLLYVLLAGGVALLVAGWWFGRNWQLYGDPLGLSVFQATYATQPFAWRSPAAWGGALWQLYSSFWARFGWLSVHPPAWALAGYTALAGLALGGLVWAALPLRRGRLGLQSPWLGVVLLPLCALAWTLAFALLAGLVAWQGRMLFPALPAIALLLARGLAEVGRRMPKASIAGVGLVGTLALLALYLPYGVIAPAYEWRTLSLARAQAMMNQPVYARFAQPWEQGIELRGWGVMWQGKHIVPGAPGVVPITAAVHSDNNTIRIVLLWHALERVGRNWTVFVHLVDAEGNIVAEHNSIPQQGQYPMPLWAAGDWLRDMHPLDVPPDLPPGTYRLRVGLYLPWQRDPQQGHRQQVWNRAGEHVGDFAEVGELRVSGAGGGVCPPKASGICRPASTYPAMFPGTLYEPFCFCQGQ